MIDAPPPSQQRDGGDSQLTIARRRRHYYAINQCASLVRNLDDARFVFDNGEAERAIRPLAIGRSNWLLAGGEGGLKTASVLLSVCANARQNGPDSWAHLTHVLFELTVRSAGADLADLLADEWGKTHLGRVRDAG